MIFVIKLFHKFGQLDWRSEQFPNNLPIIIKKYFFDFWQPNSWYEPHQGHEIIKLYLFINFDVILFLFFKGII